MEIAGRTLLGKYKVERLLGQGGMGSVWLGKHVITGRQVAVKVLDERFLGNVAVVQRFGREARSASAIQHEGIVEVLDLDMTEEGVPFLVMEFLEGESLAQRIERKTRLSEEETVRLGVQLLDALHAAHERGVIHRDLKPDNVFVVPTGRRGDRVKILDFGISSKLDEGAAKLTVTGSVLGTPHYMSPEQASGDQDLDRRADIYAAGVLLYECVVGQVPFDAPNYNKLLRNILEGNPASPIERGAMISRGLESVILNAMHRDRDQRPATASVLRAALLATHQLRTSLEPGEASRRSSRPPPPPPSSLEEPSIGTSSDEGPPLSTPRWDLSSLEAAVVAPPPSASRSRSRLPREASAASSSFDDLGPAAPPPRLEIDLSALEATRKKPSTPPPRIPSDPAPALPGDPMRPDARVDAMRPDVMRPDAMRPDAMRPDAMRTGPNRSYARTPIAQLDAPAEEAPKPAPGSPWSRLSPETRRYILLGSAALVIFVGVVFAVRWVVRPESVRHETEASLANDTVPDAAPVPPSRDWVLVQVDGVPPGAQLRLDGLPGVNLPLRIRRGTTHTLEIRAPGYVDRRLEVRGDEGVRIRAELQPLAGHGEIRP